MKHLLSIVSVFVLSSYQAYGSVETFDNKQNTIHQITATLLTKYEMQATTAGDLQVFESTLASLTASTLEEILLQLEVGTMTGAELVTNIQIGCLEPSTPAEPNPVIKPAPPSVPPQKQEWNGIIGKGGNCKPMGAVKL